MKKAVVFLALIFLAGLAHSFEVAEGSVVNLDLKSAIETEPSDASVTFYRNVWGQYEPSVYKVEFVKLMDNRQVFLNIYDKDGSLMDCSYVPLETRAVLSEGETGTCARNGLFATDIDLLQITSEMVGEKNGKKILSFSISHRMLGSGTAVPLWSPKFRTLEGLKTIVAQAKIRGSAQAASITLNEPAEELEALVPKIMSINPSPVVRSEGSGFAVKVFFPSAVDSYTLNIYRDEMGEDKMFSVDFRLNPVTLATPDKPTTFYPKQNVIGFNYTPEYPSAFPDAVSLYIQAESGDQKTNIEKLDFYKDRTALESASSSSPPETATGQGSVTIKFIDLDKLEEKTGFTIDDLYKAVYLKKDSSKITPASKSGADSIMFFVSSQGEHEIWVDFDGYEPLQYGKITVTSEAFE